jgi:hypothetical protein
LPKDIEKEAGMRKNNDQGNYIEDPPEPYQPTEPIQLPPSYLAYNQPPEVEHPEFPADAIEFALRASAPPQSTMAADFEKDRRALNEMEQGQYYRSIKYGDQCNRGLEDLAKFQEDLLTEVAEATGLTTKEIERRRKLSSFDDEIEKCEI